MIQSPNDSVKPSKRHTYCFKVFKYNQKSLLRTLCSTFYKNQKSFTVEVFEGERLNTKDNFFVNKFLLYGFHPLPKGVPQINAIFDVDVNDIVEVHHGRYKHRNKKDHNQQQAQKAEPERDKKNGDKLKWYKVEYEVPKKKVKVNYAYQMRESASKIEEAVDETID
ncbi:Heat shock protein 5 [Glycine soja]